ATRWPSSSWWPSPGRSTSTPPCSSSTSPPPASTPTRVACCSGGSATSATPSPRPEGPPSTPAADEVGELFRVIRDIRDAGVAVLFVSHFLDQVYAIADRVTILRNGKLVGEYPLAELSRLEMVKKMVGQELAGPPHPHPQPPPE